MNQLFEKLLQQNNQVQEAIKHIKMSGEAGAGMVKVEMDGQYHIVEISIDDEIYKEGKSVVVDLVAAATNTAVEKVRQAIKDKMVEMAKNFGMPANFNLPFFS